MKSVPIATKVVSWNPAHGEVYLIQHYVIKLWQVGGDFLRVPPISSTNNTNHQDIGESDVKHSNSNYQNVWGIVLI